MNGDHVSSMDIKSNSNWPSYRLHAEGKVTNGIYNFIVNLTIALFDGLLFVSDPWGSDDIRVNIRNLLVVE